VATVSTGAPLTIGNFLGLAAETENLSEWATKHSYVLSGCFTCLVGAAIG
jgi:hypothetical protein